MDRPLNTVRAVKDGVAGIAIEAVVVVVEAETEVEAMEAEAARIEAVEETGLMDNIADRSRVSVEVNRRKRRNLAVQFSRNSRYIKIVTQPNSKQINTITGEGSFV